MQRNNEENIQTSRSSQRETPRILMGNGYDNCIRQIVRTNEILVSVKGFSNIVYMSNPTTNQMSICLGGMSMDRKNEG
jgi:hypothetical protein